MTVQPVMGAERTVFYRERAASYYSAGPYTMVGTPGEGDGVYPAGERGEQGVQQPPLSDRLHLPCP